MTLFDVLDAVRYVIPALEIIDARSHQIDPDTKRPRKVFDTIADNAANAGVAWAAALWSATPTCAGSAP